MKTRILILLIILNSNYTKADLELSESKSAKIKVLATNVQKGDLVNLVIWKRVLSDNNAISFKQEHMEFQSDLENKGFEIEIDSISDLMYLSLYYSSLNFDSRRLMDMYYILPDDSISLIVERSNSNDFFLKFSGRGSDKFTIRYELDSIYPHLINNYPKLTINENDSSRYSIEHFGLNKAQWIFEKQIEYLDSFNIGVEEFVYNLLYQDLFFKISNSFLLRKLNIIYGSQTSLNKKLLADFFQQNSFLMMSAKFDEKEMTFSPYFVEYALNKKEVENKVYHESEMLLYELIKKGFNGVLQEKVITAHFLKSYSFYNNALGDSLLNDAFNYIKEEEYLKLLNQLRQTDKGTEFPEFELIDSDGITLNNEHLKGKVIFIDFFYTGCGNCISYFKNTVSKVEEFFRDNPKVLFISVSADKDIKVWKKTLDGNLYTSSTSKNVYTGGQGFDHPLIKSLNITGYPHPILLDCESKIYNNNFNELGRDKNYKQLIALIENALQECSKRK